MVNVEADKHDATGHKVTGNHAVQCPSIKQSAFNDRILGRIGFSLSIHHMRCHGFNAATVLGPLPGRP